MISQFFIMSPRGDTLIFKDYRGDVPRSTTDKFWREVKYAKGDAHPVFVSSTTASFSRRSLVGGSALSRVLVDSCAAAA